jgi:transcriptional regulator with XRE-family HTH domain
MERRAVECLSPEALRRLREERNLTRSDLAHLSGISFTTIGRLERGATTPTRGTLRLLSIALDEADP